MEGSKLEEKLITLIKAQKELISLFEDSRDDVISQSYQKQLRWSTAQLLNLIEKSESTNKSESVQLNEKSLEGCKSKQSECRINLTSRLSEFNKLFPDSDFTLKDQFQNDSRTLLEEFNISEENLIKLVGATKSDVSDKFQ